MNAEVPFSFAHGWWLAALIALPLVALLRRTRRVSLFVVPFAAEWHRPGPSWRVPWQAVLLYLGLTLLMVALARPQKVQERQETRQQGYDIVIALDLSRSMLAEDYERGDRRINRLQAVKPVLDAFISRRPNDRIGLVVFAGRAYTFAPLTFDHQWLRDQNGRLEIGLLEDGTAIGDGLGVALSRLDQGRRETGLKREGAFAVLLTDGANNAGALDPRQAAALAADRGVTVFTIGAGHEGLVLIPIHGPDGRVVDYRRVMSDLDEILLRDIADKTGGKYFRADDSRTIAQAFDEIDQARKVEFEARSFVVTDELFPWFAAPGLALLAIAALGLTLQPPREVAA